VVDPDRYRDKQEVEQGRAADPIIAFAQRLTEANLLDENGVHEMEERVQREVDEAVTFADESPYPSVEAFMQGLQEYVYAPNEAEEKGA